jgi:hypothetical protein
MGKPGWMMDNNTPIQSWELFRREQLLLTPVVNDGSSFYVAFLITDGDNMQWLLNKFIWNPFWWASQHRDAIPFTWGMHRSALYQIAGRSNTLFAPNFFSIFASGYSIIVPKRCHPER